jgi:tetratricopeptide (TPR) repeat protein
VHKLGVVTSNRYLLVPLGALLVVALSYGLTAFSGTRARPTLPTFIDEPDTTTQLENPGSGSGVGAAEPGDTDRKIAFWLQRIKNDPNSDAAYQYLGELFAKKGRETGDVSMYARANEALKQAVAIYPGNINARSGLARNLVTLHLWAEGIEQSRQIVLANPRAIGAIGVLGDASLEIGDIEGAEAAFQELQRQIGGPSVDTRFARLTYLRGNTSDATRMADAAATAATELNASGEEQAFYRFGAGEYRWGSGDIDGADEQYQAALSLFPNYYLALAGRGRVAFARGDLSNAIEFSKTAAAVIPKPELLAYLGDLYALQGDATNAEKQYQAVDFIVKLNEIQAQVYNREIALFQATHRRDTAHAVKIAAGELVVRKDIYGYDAFAWALYANGQAAEAFAPAQQAVALGTQDARLFYHLGMIELATGRTADGRANLRAALALNPAFDPLGAADAKQALGQ